MTDPPPPVPSLSPAEMQILVSRTGLVLNPGQVADLVLAWRQVAMLIGTIPHNRPLADDMAVSFRLPPPVQASPALAPRAAKPGAPTTKQTTAQKPAGKAASSRKPVKPAAPKRASRTR